MNQMVQNSSDLQNASNVDDGSIPRPHFAKPQRVAFVQASWHREVVEECRR